MSNARLRVLASLLLFTAAAPSAPAEVLVHSVELVPTAVPWSQFVALPRFDPNLGMLRFIRINLSGLVSGTLGLENTDPQMGNSGHLIAAAHVTVADLPLGGSFYVNPAFDNGFPTLAPYDGVTDFAGPSGESFTFADVGGDGAPSHTLHFYSLSSLVGFTGPAGNPGTFTVTLSAADFTGVPVAPAVVHSLALQARATLRVEYEYFTSTFFCNPLIDTAAALCPCANVSPSPNACANSVSPSGSPLQSQGQASIANDTLTLSAHSMPNTTALFVQSGSFTYGGFHFGDGMNCLAGPVIRLATRAISGGTAQYPAAGDPAISAQGQVPAPGTPRYYQVLYRDPASACGNGPFNLTGGIAVVWQP